MIDERIEETIRGIKKAIGDIAVNQPSKRTGFMELSAARSSAVKVNELARRLSVLLDAPATPIGSAPYETQSTYTAQAGVRAATAAADADIQAEISRRMRKLGLNPKYVNVTSADQLDDLK